MNSEEIFQQNWVFRTLFSEANTCTRSHLDCNTYTLTNLCSTDGGYFALTDSTSSCTSS